MCVYVMSGVYTPPHQESSVPVCQFVFLSTCLASSVSRASPSLSICLVSLSTRCWRRRSLCFPFIPHADVRLSLSLFLLCLFFSSTFVCLRFLFLSFFPSGGFKSPKCEWRSCGKASLKILSLGLTVLSVTFLLLLPFLLSSPPRSLSCADQQQTSVDFSHLLSQGGKERDDGARTNSTRRREEGGRNDPGEPLLLLQSYAETLVTIYRRLFPFHRGLFEDYVANFWVVASPFLRLRRRMAGKNDASSSAEIGAPDKPQQAPYLVASVVLTLLGFLPACIGVYRHPTRQRFLQALFCSSSSFFLFSWMVHEKAILLPVTSVLLLTLSHSGIHTRKSCRGN